MDAVQYAVIDEVATVTLNRPASLNAMNEALLSELVAALEEAHADTAVRAVMLTGAGRGFCSGADLSQQWAEMPAGPNEAVELLSSMPVPTVARVQGVAAGGGLGLALSCDVTIAARSASFVCTFGPRLGLVPDVGATWHLPNRVGRARALGIALLGERISAEQAAEWGLIWAVVDDGQLDAKVAEVLEVFKRSSPDAMYRIRSSVDAAATHTLREQLEVERAHAQVLIPRNMAEGSAAFLERREPRFSGRRTEVG